MVKKLSRWTRRSNVCLTIIGPDYNLNFNGKVRTDDDWIVVSKNQSYLRREYYFLTNDGEYIPLVNSGQFKVKARNKRTLVMDLRPAFRHRWN